MSDNTNIKNMQSLSIFNDDDFNRIKKICNSLNSIEKIKVMKAISVEPKNLSELAFELKLPISSASYYVEALQEAKLINVSYQPGVKGKTKICSKASLGFSIEFDDKVDKSDDIIDVFEMPVGAYVDCQITPPCGMAGVTSVIGKNDEPTYFYAPERINAEIIWFNQGYVTYVFPHGNAEKDITKLSLSLELCSETQYYRNDWPSDITIWINNIEITTYTSPGDFGGRKGYFTPSYWFINSTQFGILKTFSITNNGVYIDRILKTKNITLLDLKLNPESPIKVKIGIKDDAKHKGGINIFGKRFGDYPQSIILQIEH